MNISDFSDRMLAGQRLMAGFEGPGFNDDARYLVETLNVGGIILFSGNLEGPEEIREMCAAAQACAAACGLPPLFVAIDQEGGAVARLKAPFTQFPGNPSIHDEKSAARFGEMTAVELAHIGVNMDMAPVMDVASLRDDSIMKNRSFPGSPDNVARLGCRVIERLQAGGVMAVAKHFPGLGRTTADTHIDCLELETSAGEMTATDLVPFQAAIDCGVAGIMLSHVLYSDWDRQWPAGMSEAIAGKLLREKMKFDGLVMTDDLDMGAMARHYDIETVIRRVVEAGIDLALVCHRGPGREIAADTLLHIIQESESGRREALNSVERILRLKRQYLKRELKISDF
ncbi:MAG: glycoside hydrolase family 3 N-terminal domain-containing protein [Thermodesulfobacteriota bacterium]